jgi:endothelin-converting enzyme/putative endopeptidase
MMAGFGVSLGLGMMAMALAAGAEAARAQQTPAQQAPAKQVYVPVPSFDTSSLDTTVDPCTDFYKFSCGKFAANHPIPADQAGVDQFYALYNVNTQALDGFLTKAAAGGAGRSANEQKIGDYYKACMDTAEVERKGLAPVEPLLKEIDGLSDGMRGKLALPALIGKLQRMSVDVFFGYGEQQDLKDATKQIAFAQQAGIGMPEKDYYLRTGEKDVKLREQYVAHVAKMLTLAGSTPEQAKKDAAAIMAFETALAKGSLGVVDMRDPEKTYHLQPIATFEAAIPGVNFPQFEKAVHSPLVSEINNATPEFFPVLVQQEHGAGRGAGRGLCAAVLCRRQQEEDAGDGA